MRLNQPYPRSLMLLLLAPLLGCLTLAAWGQGPSPTPEKSLPGILEFGRKL